MPGIGENHTLVGPDGDYYHVRGHGLVLAWFTITHWDAKGRMLKFHGNSSRDYMEALLQSLEAEGYVARAHDPNEERAREEYRAMIRAMPKWRFFWHVAPELLTSSIMFVAFWTIAPVIDHPQDTWANGTAMLDADVNPWANLLPLIILGFAVMPLFLAFPALSARFSAPPGGTKP